MTDLACITVSMSNVSPCIVRGVHFASCDGVEWRASDAGEVSTGRACPGCVPKEAKHGLLCPSCWGNVTRALDEADEYMQVIGGVERLVQGDGGGGGSSEPQLPLPVTALLLDELNSYLRSYHHDATVWVASEAGAKDAIKFARAFRAATRNHPIKETPHGIKRTRCPDCEQVTLVWFPPAYETDHVRVSCRNPECSYETDQERFTELATSGGRA